MENDCNYPIPLNSPLLNNLPMKTIFKIFIVFIAVLIFQACKTKETSDRYASLEKTDASETKDAEARMLKKKQIEKMTAEKAAERELARSERLKASATFKDASGRIVYNKAEVDPSFAGGTQEMRLFLQNNLKYPETAKKEGFEGTVFVDFIIDEKGQVREVVATDVVGEDVDFLLKEEAVRVVASMPNWTPGMQHGKPVDTSFSIPITFEID